MKATRRWMFRFLLVGAWSGYSQMAAAAQVAVAAIPEATVRARADGLLSQMSSAEKAAQLTQYFYVSAVPALSKAVDANLATTGAGSVLFVTDPKEIDRLQHIAVDQSRMKIPLLFGFDVVHGFHTIFPVPLGLAASWDPALVESTQAIAAGEARSVGVQWAFAPMVDIAQDPRWGRIVEGAGEDPYLGSKMAAAQVRGLQGAFIGSPNRLMATPKHFAGYGAAIGGRDYDEVNLSDEQLWNVYLPPFKAAIDAGAGSIMSAYMALNGVPASSNSWLLTDVLRKTWKFKGFVVSDAGAVESLITHGLAKDPADAAGRALNAGLDMEMTGFGKKPAMATLPMSVQAGVVDQKKVDDAVRLILEAKIRLGLFEHPFIDPNAQAAAFDDPTHLALARLAAQRSAVLLKNESGLLPLDRKSIKSIAVIGPLANSASDLLGPWSFDQNKISANSILSAIRAKVEPAGVRVDYSLGTVMAKRDFHSPFEALSKTTAPETESADDGIERAVELARQDDVAILVLGEAKSMSGEMASRSSLDLPGRQQALLDAVVATGKPVIVVLMSARPLDLKDTAAAAILDIWYPGSAGGEATSDLLFGDAGPGGKLPITWIRNAAQAPNPYAQLISHEPQNVDKRYWNGSSKPTYPFGYGLSYTKFQYSNLTVEKGSSKIGDAVHVTVDLRNVGAREGDEVAQLYIHHKWGTSSRPARQLKGFQRVSLNPGETRTLHFTLSPSDLSYWSSVTRNWIQDATQFDIWIGGDSAATLTSSFAVTK